MRDRVSALLRALASIFWLCVAAMILSNTAAIAKDELHKLSAAYRLDRFRRGYTIDEKGQGATPNLH